MPDLLLEQAVSWRNACGRPPNDTGPRNIPLSADSFGVVPTIPDRDTTTEHLVAVADQAMLLAKRDGMNCVRYG